MNYFRSTDTTDTTDTTIQKPGFKRDTTGHPFVTMTCDKAMRNRQGETTEVESIEFSKTSSPNHGYSLKCLLYDRIMLRT